MIDLEHVDPEKLKLALELRKHVKVPPKILAQHKLLGMPIEQFASQHYYLDDGNTLYLQPHQIVMLHYAFNPANCPPFGFQTVLTSMPKKSGKTELAGLVCRWCAETWGGANQVYTVANDKEQNRGRIYGAVSRSIMQDPGYDKGRKILVGDQGDRWRIIERDLFHIPTSSIIRAIAGDHEGEAGSNPTITAWCIDEETEILTSNGWRTHTTFDLVNDLVATRNPLSGVFEWQKARDVNITQYNGKMYSAVGKNINMLVSPNHRLWAQLSKASGNYKRTEWDFVSVETASQSPVTHIPDAFSEWVYTNTDEVFEPLGISMELYARLMGWYLSEGCLHKNRTVMLGCKAGSDWQEREIHQLISELGFAPSRWNSGEGGLNNSIVFHNSTIAQYLHQFGLAQDKFVPQQLKESKYLRTFFDTYVKGDGCIEGSRIKISTASSKMSDDLQEIGLKLGYWVSSSVYNDPRPIFKKTPHPLHTVRFYNGQNGQHTHQIRKSMWETVDYDGVIWCPSTPNGIITVRRNNKVYQTGNTEIWALRLERDKRLWAEMTPVPTRERSMRYVETYAGYKGESNVLWDLWEQAVKYGKHLTLNDVPNWPFEADDDEGHVPFYVNYDARLFAYIDQGPRARRMPWQQGERGDSYYSAQAWALRNEPGQFERLHNNYWVERASAFIPIQLFMNCYDESLKEYDKIVKAKHIPCVLGADAAVSGDCTAIVLTCRHPVHHADTICLYAKKWDPPAGGQMDYRNTIEADIKRLFLEYNIVEVCYDPTQLHHLMYELRRTDKRRSDPDYFPSVNTREFSQGTERRKSDKRLYDMIRDQQTHHDGLMGGGYDDMLTHIQNSGAEYADKEDRSLKIVKLDTGKIDLTVAYSMSNHRCCELVL